MEIFNWSGQAIKIVDEARFDGGGRIDRPDQIRVFGNFIHNNQHIGAEGYGVAVGQGANARITENVFDFNRHAVEANGDRTATWPRGISFSRVAATTSSGSTPTSSTSMERATAG